MNPPPASDGSFAPCAGATLLHHVPSPRSSFCERHRLTKTQDCGRNAAFGDLTMRRGSLNTLRFRPIQSFRPSTELMNETPNNTLERTVNRSGRIVLAMDCVLADAERRQLPAAQLDR